MYGRISRPVTYSKILCFPPFLPMELPFFGSHCRELRMEPITGKEYLWAGDKIYSFWCDQLTALLEGNTPLATAGKIHQLIRPAKSSTVGAGKRVKQKTVSIGTPPPLMCISLFSGIRIISRIVLTSRHGGGHLLPLWRAGGAHMCQRLLICTIPLPLPEVCPCRGQTGIIAIG